MATPKKKLQERTNLGETITTNIPAYGQPTRVIQDKDGVVLQEKKGIVVFSSHNTIIRPYGKLSTQRYRPAVPEANNNQTTVDGEGVLDTPETIEEPVGKAGKTGKKRKQ